jgi:hypothetical protein
MLRLNEVSSVLAVTFVGTFWYVFKESTGFLLPMFKHQTQYPSGLRGRNPKTFVTHGGNNNGNHIAFKR